MDNIVVNFWANERVSPDVVTEVRAKVPCKVIAALVIGVPGKRVPTDVSGVGTQVLAADSRHQITADLLLDRGKTIHRVEVIEDRPVRQYEKCAAIADAVRRLPKSGCNLSAKPDVVFQYHISAEAD